MSRDRANLFKADHYEAVGRLAIACTRLDVVMTALISGITGMEKEDALIVFHHLKFDNKVESLKRLVKRGEGCAHVPIDKLPSLLSEAKSVYAYRNRLVHDAWVVGEKGTSPVTEQIVAHGTSTDRKHRPTKEVRAYAEKANALADRLEAIAAFF